MVADASERYWEPVNHVKGLLLKVVPDRVVFEAKKLLYSRAVRRFSVAHEAVLRALVRPGDHALDLGANAGWYSRILSELVGPTGRVYSVEPVPPTFELLVRSVRKLRLDNVQPINSAVSDHSGSIVMEVPAYEGGGINFYQAHIVDGEPDGVTARRKFRVPVTSIDTLLGQLARPISFVKCDVEGHEWAVIRGAAEVIRRSLPSMLIEVTTDPDASGTTAHDLFTWLDGAGYRPYRFDGKGLVARRSGDRSVDYFFLTRRHLAMIEEAHIPAG